MKLVSVSLFEIECHIIDYFAGRFSEDPSVLDSGTNLKVAFNFNDASWAQLADTLSEIKWMRALHVVLSQPEMNGAPTVEQLARLIMKHLNHVVAVPTSLEAVVPLSSIVGQPLRASLGTSAKPIQIRRNRKKTK